MDSLQWTDLQQLIEDEEINDNPTSLVNLNCEYIDVDKLNNSHRNSENKLTCTHLNIQSLSCKVDKLKILLCELDENKSKPAVLLLCETWLNMENNTSYNIDGYRYINLYRKNRRVEEWLYMLTEILLLNHVWTLEVSKKVNLSDCLLKLC